MTPRTEAYLLEVNDSIKDNISYILSESFSRIPVYDKDFDNIVGVLYMKDIFASIVEKGIDNISIKDIMKKPYFVPETNSIDNLFRELQTNRNHMAILIDEYGGFSGIVTIEDIIEEVMGEICDEYDDEQPEIEKVDEENYIVSGLLTLSDLNDFLNLSLDSEVADTIGGLFLETFGTFPKDTNNHQVQIDNVTLKLLALDDRRIDKIHLIINKSNSIEF